MAQGSQPGVYWLVFFFFFRFDDKLLCCRIMVNVIMDIDPESQNKSPESSCESLLKKMTSLFLIVSNSQNLKVFFFPNGINEKSECSPFTSHPDEVLISCLYMDQLDHIKGVGVGGSGGIKCKTLSACF